MSYSLTDREMASVDSVSDGRPQIVVELTRGAVRTKKGQKKKANKLLGNEQVSCLERKRKGKKKLRSRQDSNLRGETPMDF